MFNHACVRTVGLGVFFGFLAVVWVSVAFAQDPAQPVAATLETDILLRLLASAEFPAILGLLGWWLPRVVDSMIQQATSRAITELKTWEPTVNIQLPKAELGAGEVDALRKRIDALVIEFETARKSGTSPV